MRDHRTRPWTLSFLPLACAYAVSAAARAAAPEGPPPPPAPRADATRSPAACDGAGAGLRKPGGFLTLSPGVLAVTHRGDPQPLYMWGLDGGYHLPIGPVFAMQLGGFFEL